MTETVQCRVCGCPAPLGTAECPDCGAPLPQELPKETPPPLSETAEDALPEAGRNKKEKHPARHPLLRRVAVFLALCLVAELALFALPQKQPPPGVVLTAGGFVTPDGVWDYEADGFFFTTATSDGRYVILRQVGEEALSKVKSLRGVLSSSSMSYTYVPEGDYYLFDGRTLERTEWDMATLTDNGTVFYTVADETGTTLSRRELTTGKASEIQRVEGEADLADLRPSADGTAVAYRWETDGEEAEPYLLWRRGDKAPTALDGQGTLMGVGNGGRTCLFWNGETLYGWDGSAHYGTLGDGENSGYYLWRDGESVYLSGWMPMWCNNALTELLLREEREDSSGDWYYYDMNAMTAPVRLDASNETYLIPAVRNGNLWWSGYGSETLKGRFYVGQTSGGSAVYYLTRRGTLLPVTEGLEGGFLLDEAGQNAVYLKDGDLYRAAVLPDETVETVQFTQTVGSLTSSSLDAGSVDAFAANGDLTHIYYVAQSPEGYRGGKVLYHWHDGASHALDFEYGLTYNAYQNAIEVTPEGGCYVQNSGNVYYTEKDAPPTLILEDAGMGTQPQLVGPDRWPLVTGTTWEGGASKQLYWRLDGDKEPIGLTEWAPKEGKI